MSERAIRQIIAHENSDKINKEISYTAQLEFESNDYLRAAVELLELAVLRNTDLSVQLVKRDEIIAGLLQAMRKFGTTIQASIITTDGKGIPNTQNALRGMLKVIEELFCAIGEEI